MTHAFDPYCGPAPTGQNLVASWNLDIILIAALAATIVAAHYVDRQRTPWRTAALGALLVIAFVSPLCAMTTALFSVRLAHHILIGSVIAPLLFVMVRSQFNAIIRLPPVAIFLAHTVIYWMWHLPAGYQFALSGTAQYWLMQLGLIVTSVALWGLLLSRQVPVITALGLSLGTMVQMGFLGAILTFAPEPLFEAHFGVTQAFGLSPLHDQQLAGVLMWTVGFAPYVIVALWSIRARVLTPRHVAGQ